MHKMKLTCVTATWNVIKAGNRESLIRCVQSVAALKTEHEHLIYDGASTDGTAELLRELESTTPGLKVVSEPDTGIYNALNKGVRDAKGEWFYVLGADDYIFAPDVMDDILANETEDVDLIISPVIKDGNVNDVIPMVNKWGIFAGSPYCHQGVLARTNEVRLVNGFNEKYRIAADHFMMLSLHDAAKRYRCVDKAYASYSLGGVSAKQLDATINEFRKVTCEYFSLREDEKARYVKSQVLPWRIILPRLFHRDMYIRRSAWQNLYLRIKLILRIPLYPLVVLTRPLRYRK